MDADDPFRELRVDSEKVIETAAAFAEAIARRDLRLFRMHDEQGFSTESLAREANLAVRTCRGILRRYRERSHGSALADVLGADLD